METKEIKKTKTIAAPKEKVWNVLLEDDYNRIWMAEFMAGSHAETDWIVGHKVRFMDSDKNGIVGRIAAKQPYNLIDIEYDGEVVQGEDVFDTPGANAMKGMHEIYRLSQVGNETTLDVSVEMGAEYHDMMSEAWDRALEKIEELAISV